MQLPSAKRTTKAVIIPLQLHTIVQLVIIVLEQALGLSLVDNNFVSTFLILLQSSLVG